MGLESEEQEKGDQKEKGISFKEGVQGWAVIRGFSPL